MQGPFKRLTLLLVLALLALALSVQASVGMRLVKIPCEGASGGELTGVCWYPSDSLAAPYTYPLGQGVRTKLAYEAPVAEAGKPYPLVVLSHGFSGCAAGLAYLAESLARTGFVAIGADHQDSVIMERSDRNLHTTYADLLRMLAAAKHLNQQMDWPDLCKRRVPEAKATLNFALEANKTPGSFLYKAIDESKIGMGGHSYGAWTTFLCAGGLGEQYKDPRIKAALCLSSPSKGNGSWKESDLKAIDVPLFFMYGQLEGPQGTPPRLEALQYLYSEVSGPKLLAELRGASHFTFGGTPARKLGSVQAVVNSRLPLATGTQYMVAFFKYYLQNDAAAGRLLGTPTSAFTKYEVELARPASSGERSD